MVISEVKGSLLAFDYLCTLPLSYIYSNSFRIVWFSSNTSFIVFANLGAQVKTFFTKTQGIYLLEWYLCVICWLRFVYISITSKLMYIFFVLSVNHITSHHYISNFQVTWIKMCIDKLPHILKSMVDKVYEVVYKKKKIYIYKSKIIEIHIIKTTVILCLKIVTDKPDLKFIVFKFWKKL